MFHPSKPVIVLGQGKYDSEGISLERLCHHTTFHYEFSQRMSKILCKMGRLRVILSFMDTGVVNRRSVLVNRW